MSLIIYSNICVKCFLICLFFLSVWLFVDEEITIAMAHAFIANT